MDNFCSNLLSPKVQPRCQLEAERSKLVRLFAAPRNKTIQKAVPSRSYMDETLIPRELPTGIVGVVAIRQRNIFRNPSAEERSP